MGSVNVEKCSREVPRLVDPLGQEERGVILTGQQEGIKGAGSRRKVAGSRYYPGKRNAGRRRWRSGT